MFNSNIFRSKNAWISWRPLSSKVLCSKAFFLKHNTENRKTHFLYPKPKHCKHVEKSWSTVGIVICHKPQRRQRRQYFGLAYQRENLKGLLFTDMQKVFFLLFFCFWLNNSEWMLLKVRHQLAFGILNYFCLTHPIKAFVLFNMFNYFWTIGSK